MNTLPIPLLALGAMAVLALRPASLDAQSATARITASAQVVERVGAAPGQPRITSAGEHLDLSSPLAVLGRTPTVVQVVAATSAGTRTVPIPAGPPERDGAPAVHLRLPASPAALGTPIALLTYVVSTIN